MQTDDLDDIWREKNPEKKLFTWKQTKPQLVMVHLDFFLISSALVQMVDTVGILPGILSDHSLITLTILENRSDRGNGFWKLNTSLLQDKEYIASRI